MTPGLMVSWTDLGITEIDLVAETNDSAPNQALDSAAFDVADAINPHSTLIPVARIRGVTRSLTAPVDCGDVFCGTAAVIDLGKGPDLVEKRQAGVLVELEPNGGTGQKNSRPDIWNNSARRWTMRASIGRSVPAIIVPAAAATSAATASTSTRSARLFRAASRCSCT